MHIPFHQFEIKFLHVTAMAKVVIEKGNPHAVITFPLAYCPGVGNGLFYGFPIPDMEWEEVEAYVTTRFKDNFSFLNARIREVGKFNFFITRILFRTAIERTIGGFTASFTVTRQAYGISENVDGTRYHKTTFEDKGLLSTMKALYVANWQAFIQPCREAGFNDKFIMRVLKRHDKVQANQLKLIDDNLFIDELQAYPDKLNNSVAGRRFEFMVAMADHKKELL